LKLLNKFERSYFDFALASLNKSSPRGGHLGIAFQRNSEIEEDPEEICMRTQYSQVGEAMRNWQEFPGKNIIFCDGRAITAAEWGTFAYTLSIISVMGVLFFVFEYAADVNPSLIL
jgi:hypothetical protein